MGVRTKLKAFDLSTRVIQLIALLFKKVFDISSRASGPSSNSAYY